MILVIDDDKVARKVIVRCLERLGLQTIECENGRQGWEMLWDNDEINLVITDMVMPDMDGRELVHLVRAHEEVNHLPVIMVSGVLTSAEIEPIMKISPTNTFFLNKPLDMGLLEMHINLIGVREGKVKEQPSSAH